MADPIPPRGPTWLNVNAAMLTQLTRPKRWWHSLVAAAVILCPAVLGNALPMLALHFGRASSRDMPQCLVAMMLLAMGGYGLYFAWLSGSFDRATPSPFALAPSLDTSRPPPSGSLALVEGRVRLIEGTSVRGPLTGREGAWSIATVMNQFPHGRNEKDVRPSLDVLTDAVPFEVVDARGHAVRVEPAEGSFPSGRSIEDDGSCYPEGVAACIARSDLGVEPGERVRVSERVLRAGDPITVVGVLRHGEGYRGGADSLVLVSDAKDELQVRLGPRSEALRSWRGNDSRTPAVIAALMIAAGLAITIWIAL